MTSTSTRRRSPKAFIVDFLIVLVGFFLIIALLESPTKVKIKSIATQGLYAVTQTCPANNLDDVDLYVRDPNGNTSWYYQPTAGLMHLEQDIIPGFNTVEGNIKIKIGDDERTIIRGAVPGEYIVNIHLYNQYQRGPVTCYVTLWDLKTVTTLTVTKLTLVHQDQALTAFRFTLTADGSITNINHLTFDIVHPVDNGAGRTR